MIGAALRVATVLAAFALVLSAATLYRVKTETRAVLSEVRALERRERDLRESMAALETEWAYLSSPAMLSELAQRHAETLQLEERLPESFARLEEIPPRGAVMNGGSGR